LAWIVSEEFDIYVFYIFILCDSKFAICIGLILVLLKRADVLHTYLDAKWYTREPKT